MFNSQIKLSKTASSFNWLVTPEMVDTAAVLTICLFMRFHFKNHQLFLNTLIPSDVLSKRNIKFINEQIYYAEQYNFACGI